MIFVCVSGVVIWIQRRPSGASRLAAPPMPAEMPVWKGAVLIGLCTAMAFPLVGLTPLAALAVDLLVVSNIPTVRRAFN